MRTLGLAILLCAACAKKPAPQAPAAAPPPAMEAAPAGDAAAPAPTARPASKSSGDPCSGGERK